MEIVGRNLKGFQFGKLLPMLLSPLFRNVSGIALACLVFQGPKRRSNELKSAHNFSGHDPTLHVSMFPRVTINK